MYTKEQASKIRQKFWTSFGQYMKPVPGAGEEIVNWLNYKTGIKHIFFRMDVDNNHAYIAIELLHANEDERLQYYQQMIALKKIFEQTAGNGWQWNQTIQNKNGQTISSISRTNDNVNVLNEND